MLHAWMPCWLTLLCSRPERAGAAASRNPVEPISVPQRFRDTVLLTYCAKFSESISWDRSLLLAWSALTTFGRVWIWIQWNYILQTDKMILQHFTLGELGTRQFETPMFCSMEPFTLFLSDKGNMKEMNTGLPRYCAGGRAPEPASSAHGGGRRVRDAGGQPREPTSSARGDGRWVRDARGWARGAGSLRRWRVGAGA